MLLQKAVLAAKEYAAKQQIGLFNSCLLPTNNFELSM